MQSVIESISFMAQADKLFSEAERHEVIDLLAADPEAGDVIPGTGGIRKLRVAALGKGKRGGARVIYYYHSEALPIYALLVYAKNERADMSPDQKRAAVALVQLLKS